MTNVKTINSAMRTVLVLGAASVVGYGGYFGYNNYVKPAQDAKRAHIELVALTQKFEEQESALRESAAENKQLEKQNDRLETSMKLLKVTRRMANVTVLDKGFDENDEPFMEVSFTEVNEKNEPVGSSRNFTLKGEKFYIDGWVATFDDKYIEQADELRAASLFVFKSIYGDAERPRDAQRLDIESNDGGIPGVYKDERKREFESKIWKDFWATCNDVDLKHELGIRTANGQASYVKPIEGKTYQVNIRSTGEMSLDPIIEP